MNQSYKKMLRKRRTLACGCLLVGRKLFSCWICNKIIKNDPRNTVNWNVTKLLTKWRLLLTKRYLFYFYPTDWVILKQLSPSGSVNSAWYIHHYLPPLRGIVEYYFVLQISRLRNNLDNSFRNISSRTNVRRMLQNNLIKENSLLDHFNTTRTF